MTPRSPDARGAAANADVRAGAIPSEARRDAALARLRARGERVTPGRRAVLDVLSREPGHIDADAVAALVDEVEPGIHRATIYRSLQALVDADIVTHTHVPGGATIYHLAADVAREGAKADVGASDGDSGEGDAAGHEVTGHVAEPHSHAHLQCDTCGRFVDVDVAEFAPLAARIKELTGFTLDAEHGALLGRCAQCSKEPQPTSRPGEAEQE